MERKRKKSKKKKILIISLVSAFIILLGVFIYFATSSDIFTYKDKITIEVGEDIPTIKDYLYKNNDKIKDITWKDIDNSDSKIYKVGTYIGTFTYKGEEK